jgi:hypothetical protein
MGHGLVAVRKEAGIGILWRQFCGQVHPFPQKFPEQLSFLRAAM